MGLIGDGLLAAVLTIMSKEKEDMDMALHAVHIQARAISRLRAAFTKFGVGEGDLDQSMLSMAALTNAASELLSHKSWEKFSSHLLGVGALIENAGIAALYTAAARDNYLGYISVQGPLCFANRQCLFITGPEWLQLPWKCTHHTRDHPFHTLLKVALPLVAEIAAFDSAVPRSEEHLGKRVEHLRQIDANLDAWLSSLDASYDQPLYKLRPAIWEGLHEQSFDFVTIGRGCVHFVCQCQCQGLSLPNAVGSSVNIVTFWYTCRLSSDTN
jgi:hypothetical protein